MGAGDIPEKPLAQVPQKLWNANFILVLFLGLMTGTANQMVSPQISKYAISLGAPLTLASTIVGLFSGMAMVTRPFSGAASDLFNRKHVFVGSVLLCAVSFGGYLVFHNVTALIICRLLQGVAFSFMSVARTAYATEFIPPERMGEGVSLTTFGVVLSQAMGPSIGLWVTEQWGYNACFATAFITCIIGAVALGIRPYKSTHRPFGWGRLRLNNLIAKEVIPYAIIAGLFSIALQLVNSFLLLHSEERGIGNVMLFFTLYSIVTMAVRPFAGRVLDKYGLPILLYPSFVFASLSMGLIGMAYSLFPILLAGVCNALSQGVAIPSIQGDVIKRYGKERAGVLAATIQMGQDLLSTLAPVAGGVIATSYGYGNMFYAFSGMVLLGIPLYMALRRREKRQALPISEEVAEQGME